MDLNDWADIRANVTHVAIAASSGDTTLVSASSTQKIVVVQLALFTDGESSTVRFEGGTGGTALTGQMTIFAKNGDAITTGTATGGIVLPFSPAGWFATATNTLLNLELSGSNVEGVLTYVLE